MLAQRLLINKCMDIALSTNLFTDSANLGNAPSRPASANANSNSQFASTTADNPAPADAPETTTTDNEPPVAQNPPADTPPEEFSDSLNEQIATANSAKPEGSGKSDDQKKPAGVAVKHNLAQEWRDWLAKSSVTVENSHDGVAIKGLPKAGVELAKMIAEYKAANNFGPNTGQTTGQTENTSTETDGQSGQNPVLADPAAGTAAGGTTENTAVPDNTTVAATIENLPGQENTEESNPQAATGQTQTAAAGENAAVVDNLTNSAEPEKPVLNGEGPVIETSVGDNKTVAVETGEKPAISDTPGEVSVKEGPTEAGDNISDARQSGPGQDTPIASEVSQPVATAQNSSPISSNTDGTLDEALLKDSAPVIVQTATGQTKDSQNSTSDNNSDSTGFEQILTAGTVVGAGPVVTEFSEISAEPADKTSAGDVSANVSEQIQESIGASLRQGDKQITIQLEPPELGKVLVKFQEQDGQITGQLEVSKAETRVEIQQILPEIVRGLQESGVPLKRIEVLMTEQSGSQSLKDQSFENGQGGAFGRHNSANPDTSENNTYDSEWLASSANNTYNGFAEEEQMYVDDNSISILA